MSGGYHQSRGGRGRGGRSSYRGRGGGGRGGGRGNDGPPPGPRAKLRPCADFTSTGSCPHGDKCHFKHVVKLHASVDATIPYPQDHTQNQRYNDQRYNDQRYNDYPRGLQPVSSVAVWETQGCIKIFTGSLDGYWRLWNTQSFHKEFEHEIGSVNSLKVASNYLFCGFEAISNSLPNQKVGMIHAWNLQNPSSPPMELRIENLIPYAHNAVVTCITVEGEKLVSGSRDGSIRIWSFDSASQSFVLQQSLPGHAAEVTGLEFVEPNHLWSSSIDQSIRVWDLTKKECVLCIVGGDKGHQDAVTALLKFTSPEFGTFVLSSSLDGTIKAWKGSNGECVASETHGEGVVSMALASSLDNKPILLVGCESGRIMVRNVLQTPKAPAFQLLMNLSAKYSAGHRGEVKTLRGGPSSTFYSGGKDGKLMVWQITGDLEI